MRRGSSAVEFAVTLPLLLILISGMIDLGRQLTFADQVADAVTEAAFAGALADPAFGEDPSARAMSVAAFAWAQMDTGAPLTVTAAETGVAPDAMLEVVGTANHGLLFGMISLPVSTSYTQRVRLNHQ